jgi:dolichol-phosphate mannosyltransferase
MTDHPSISVAIPLYNEETVIPELLRRLSAVLDEMPGGPHEIVFTDDGSKDTTLALLEQASRTNDRIRVISLARNFGHQQALSAALDHVSGDVTIMMDGDLQDEPESIGELINTYKQGFDVVYAVRTQRKEGFILRTAYTLFYRIMNALSDIHMPLDSGDFALVSRAVVEQMRTMPERHRYLRGLRAWVGFRQTGIRVERQARAGGVSKYSWTGLIRLALDGVFSFSVLPIRIATLLGLLAVAFSLAYGGYAAFVRVFLSNHVPGFTTLYLMIMLTFGVNLFVLGILGEYIGRIYNEVKGRPIYVIRKVIGAPKPSDTQE